MDLDVVFLGTAGSMPTARRAPSATLVRRGGERLLFDCGDEGAVFIDGRAQPHVIHNERAQADCTVTIARADLVALMTGELDPVMGFMTGRLRVAGDMGVALKLQRIV